MSGEWINHCKANLLSTVEWQQLSKKIHVILLERLNKDKVGFFADLSFQEQFVKLLFFDNIENLSNNIL